MSVVALLLIATMMIPSAFASAEPVSSVTVAGGDLSEFDDTSTSGGSLASDPQRTYLDGPSGRARYDGGGGNGFARGHVNVDWQPGTDVWYGVAIYLPDGFRAAQQGAVDLLRWDNWSIDGSNTDQSGLALNSRGELVIMRERLGSDPYTTLLGPYDMPEGRWVHLEVRQRLADRDGEAVNELWVDGEQVASSSTANSFGRPATRLRSGIVAIDAGSQSNALELWFDQVTIASDRVGPGSGEPSPPADESSGEDASEPSDRFTDVPRASSHLEGIEWAAANGITVGCAGDGDRFCPQEPVTREQMATFLARALDLDGADPSFDDVEGRGTHASNIGALAEEGISRGCGSGDGFCPQESVTREQMTTFLYRALT